CMIWYIIVCIDLSFIIFFFQAEDGIRDRNVTGVQTCALPISRDGNHACDLTAVDLIVTSLPLPGVRPSSGAAISELPKASRESRDPAPAEHAAPEDGRTPPTTASKSLTWDLAADVSPDVLSANPHADRFGNEGVWYFYTEPDNGGSGAAPAIPAGSRLARWQSEPSPKAKEKLAQEREKLLTSDPPNAD